MIHRAGRSKPGVALASPVGHLPRAAQASRSRRRPAARWMAPSTPPPPARAELAALTTASTASVVMSPSTTSIRTLPPLSQFPLALVDWRGEDNNVVITSVPHTGRGGVPMELLRLMDQTEERAWQD